MTVAVHRLLHRLRRRYRSLPPHHRPANVLDLLSAAQAQWLIQRGAYPLNREQIDYVTGDGGRELRRLARRLVRQELQVAIPSIVAAVAEVIRRER